MKYTKEQRLDIGRRIYDGELTAYQASEEYDINHYTARNYMWLYRDINQLPKKTAARRSRESVSVPVDLDQRTTLQEYQDMSKEELIQALIQARITEARLKKGYEVKGDGSIIRYGSKNIK